MVKSVFMTIFVIFALIFLLDYFHLLPSDRTLGFNRISYSQIQKIESFDPLNSEKKEQNQPKKFTERVYK
jgi:hypothetical protein